MTRPDPAQTPRPGPDTDPLALDVETMRRTGYAVVDALAALIEQPDPVIRRATRGEMVARLDGPPPAEGVGTQAALDRLLTDVVPYASKIGHPGYVAYIPGSTTWPGALAELVAAVANLYVGSWMEAAGPTQVELTVLDWFRSWLGMPEGTDGVLVSGGSAANLTALAAARELSLGAMDTRARVYCGDQTHSSVGRAARVLGFRPDQLRVIPSDGSLRMRSDALATALERDRERGLLPLAVVAAAGSTNAGVVDPLPEIAELCRRHEVWLHVDAAYGGFAALSSHGAELLRGIERADSVTLDPHKWLFQPLECGALLVRRSGALERAFGVLPDYLADADSQDREVNFSDRGLQLSRSARALKVWTSVQAFGVDAYRQVVDRSLALARLAEELVTSDERLELTHPASLGIVCLRRRVPGGTAAQHAAVNGWLAHQLEQTGRALVSSTRLHGRPTLRMCVLNHLTQESDVRFIVDFLATTPVPDEVLGDGLRAAPAGPTPVLDLLTPAGRAFVDQEAEPRHVPGGTTLVSRWDTDRDLFVVVDGWVEVRVDDTTLQRLGSGDCFGEVAATDWGSGYGYVRTADVVATEPTTLLVLPWEAVTRLTATEPAFRAHLEQLRAQRMETL